MENCLICGADAQLYLHGIPLCARCDVVRIIFAESHGLNVVSRCSKENPDLSSATP
jgi:hypothetical protein